MKTSTLFRFVIVTAFLCLFAVSARAQASVYGYTFIDYDEETNTVMAYSETDIDYSLVGNYRPYVALTVTNGSGGLVASGSAYDFYDYDYAVVELDFAGTPDTSYTAVGSHRTRLELWDYYETYPYQTYYYDNWYFTQFEGQGIYQP